MCVLYISIQAPGACDWSDVCQFIHPSCSTYDGFLSCGILPHLTSVPFQCLTRIMPPCDLARLVSTWQAPAMLKGMVQDDDERAIQPFIHNVLETAATLAQRESHCTRYFSVLYEPALYRGTSKRRVSDEEVCENKRRKFCEVVDAKGALRILIEVEGTKKYPSRLVNGELMMSQLLQQVALARVSGFWQGFLLAGVVTRSEWNLFVLLDCTSGDRNDLRLKVIKFYSVNIVQETCEYFISDLVSLLHGYLLEPGQYI